MLSLPQSFNEILFNVQLSILSILVFLYIYLYLYTNCAYIQLYTEPSIPGTAHII